jgi:hypothetical protein
MDVIFSCRTVKDSVPTMTFVRGTSLKVSRCSETRKVALGATPHCGGNEVPAVRG